jgi:hypothetical protein
MWLMTGSGLASPAGGSRRDHSFLQTIHQSIVFRDQLRTSLSFAALDLKQPLHQFHKVFHDFLQGWKG